MTRSHLSAVHQTDINSASSETPRPTPGLWLVKPSQYWPLIGWHWPQSDPCHCHWYRGPVSLHNGGCIVTTEAWHLIIIGDQINTYSAHWRLLGPLNIRGDGIQMRISAYSSFSGHCSLCLCFKKVHQRKQEEWMSRVGRAACLAWDLWGNGQGDDSPDYHGQGKWRPLLPC